MTFGELSSFTFITVFYCTCLYAFSVSWIWWKLLWSITFTGKRSFVQFLSFVIACFYTFFSKHVFRTGLALGFIKYIDLAWPTRFDACVIIKIEKIFIHTSFAFRAVFTINTISCTSSTNVLSIQIESFIATLAYLLICCNSQVYTICAVWNWAFLFCASIIS